MDQTTLALAALTVILAGVSLYARHIGNGTRDVAALAVSAGLSGLGTAAAFLL